MLDSSNTLLKNNKKSKQPRNAAQKDWSNTMEVYNATLRSSVGSQQPQTQSQQQSVGLVVSPIVPSPATVLFNLGGENTSTQPTSYYNATGSTSAGEPCFSNASHSSIWLPALAYCNYPSNIHNIISPTAISYQFQQA